MQKIQSRQRDRPLMRSLIIPEQNRPSNSYLKPYGLNVTPTDKLVNSYNYNSNNQKSQQYVSTLNIDKQIVQNNVTTKKITQNNNIQMQDLLQKLCQSFERQQKKLTLFGQRLQALQNKYLPIDGIIQEVIHHLKKPNILRQVLKTSNFVHSANAQIYQHLFNFKLDLQGLKQQVNQLIKKKQYQSSEQKKQEQFNKFYEQLSNKINQVKQNNKITQENIIAKCQQMLKKQNCTISKIGLKSSQSTMVKYQEFLKVNNNSSILNQYVYYIDKEGYLLDTEQNYIINNKGYKIKVQEKHRELLQGMDIIK